METPYSGQTGRTTSEATTVWCGGCGIWFGSSVYRSIDAETDSSLVSSFLNEGFSALNTCVCPSCNWRHIAEEALAFHCPQRRQFFLLVPTAQRHRAQTIRADFLASVAAAPGAHVPRYVFEPVLVGSRTELKQLLGETTSSSRSGESDFSSLDIDDSYQEMFGDAPKARSVVKRSQTLNLLAELVGEESGELEDARNELDALGQSLKPKPSEGINGTVDALTTQREFEANKELELRDATAATGLLAAALDERSETQSIVMPDGVAESLENSRSQGSFEEDFESVDSVLEVPTDAEDELEEKSEAVEFESEVSETSHEMESVESISSGSQPELADIAAQSNTEESSADVSDALGDEADASMEISGSSLDGSGFSLDGSGSSLDGSGSSLDGSGSSLDGSDSDNAASDGLDGATERLDEASSVDGVEEKRDADVDADDVDASSSVMHVDEVEFDSSPDAIDANVTGEMEQIDIDEGPAADEVGEPRQRFTTGSVELAADYSEELEAHSRPPMPQDAEQLDEEIETERAKHAIHVADTGIVLSSQLSQAMIGQLNNRPVRVVPQLHVFDEGSVCTLTVMVDDETSGSLFWALERDSAADDVFNLLEADFVVQLDLRAEDGAQCLFAEYRFPYEANMTAFRRKLEAVTEEQSKRALERLREEGSTHGELSHSFERDSFSDITSAADALLALGIIEFWSEASRGFSLWGHMGFPLDWWRSIQHRVILAATEFGLPVDASNIELALSVLDIDDERAYLSMVIDNFVEVNLRIRSNGLDVVQIAQTWDRLLNRAQTLDIALDAEVEELASQALDRGDIALDDEVRPLDDSIEISLADALEVASIGGINLRELASFERPTVSMVETDLAGVSNADLVQQLNNEDERLSASLGLVNNGAKEEFEYVFTAIESMGADELSELLPALLPVAKQFHASFRGGVFADSHRLRLASALFLIESLDERVINPLLAMILDPEESEWEALALSAVHFGDAIAKPALARVSIDAESAIRVAYLLTAVEKANPGSLAQFKELAADEASQGCIQAALGQTENFENLFSELEFGDRIALTLSGLGE
ncbi:MAG: CpXC domain-containing protein [Bradymonadia bacterium]